MAESRPLIIESEGNQQNYGSAQEDLENPRVGFEPRTSRYTEKKETTPWYKYLWGIILVITAGCSFTGANVIQKIICPSLKFWNLMLIRSLAQVFLMFIWRIVTKVYYDFKCSEHGRDWKTTFFGPREDPSEHWYRRIRILIFLQGTFGGLLLMTLFVAVKNVPLGNVSAIIFCTPVSILVWICVLFSRACLKIHLVLLFNSRT